GARYGLSCPGAAARPASPCPAGRFPAAARSLRSRPPFLPYVRVRFPAGLGEFEPGKGGLVKQPLQRPDRGAAHDRRLLPPPRLGGRRECWIAGIADRDQHVAAEAVAPGALHRRAGEALAERRIVEPGEFGQRRYSQRRRQRQPLLPARRREFVPRADREAIV